MRIKKITCPSETLLKAQPQGVLRYLYSNGKVAGGVTISFPFYSESEYNHCWNAAKMEKAANGNLH